MLSTMTIFFKISEHTVRGMAGYAGKSIFMVGIFLHDCKEPDMVGLLDGNSHGVNFHFCPVDEAVIASSWCGLSVSLLSTAQK